MMKGLKHLAQFFCVIAFALATGQAGAQPRPGYGPAVNLETAKKIAAASLAEARRNNWNVAVAG